MAALGSSVLSSSSGERFRRVFKGRLTTKTDQSYEDLRKVWNGTIDRRPALIASCFSVEDVIAAVRFAGDQGFALAVRGGGHSFPGFSTCDDGMVIDLSPMASVEVDPAARVARAGGGTTWGGFDAATHTHGLAATGGLVSTTGVAGLTLGGGIGWLMRKHGLACDNLLAAEVVTADGDVVRASAGENPELFWGLRGGGGNFGIVTAFEFRLHPVSAIYGGLVLFDGSRTPEVLRFYRNYVHTLGDDCATMLSAITAPAADFVPAGLHGRPAMAFAVCHVGDREQAQTDLRPVREFRPDVDLLGSMPYPELQQMFDADLPHGIRCYLKAGYLPALSDAAIEVISERTRPMSSPASTFDFHHMGGAVARVGDEDTAFGDRRSPFCFNIVGLWSDSADDERHRSSVREFAAAMEPFSTGGVYVNFSADADAVSAAYGGEKFERLRALKRRYDPTNLFGLNQNIAP